MFFALIFGSPQLVVVVSNVNHFVKTKVMLPGFQIRAGEKGQMCIKKKKKKVSRLDYSEEDPPVYLKATISIQEHHVFLSQRVGLEFCLKALYHFVFHII